jgi:hypothetical protein
MVRRIVFLAVIAVLVLAVAAPALAKRGGEGGRGNGPEIYVTGQGLIYDSIVTAKPVANHGPFQLLEEGGPTGLMTEFGPGDPGYVGGRWWLDGDGDGIRDDDEVFVCPLLGPGVAP